MSKLNMQTSEGQEAWIIARLQRSPIITDWEATENPKRAAAWNRLVDRGVIRPAKDQPEYPYNKFEIHQPGSRLLPAPASGAQGSAEGEAG